MTEVDVPFLLTKAEAVKRYSISVRKLEQIYRRNPEFPVLHVGRKVLVYRDGADAFFTRYIREVIDTE